MMETDNYPPKFVIKGGERAVCRGYLAIMAGLYEADAIKETFGAPMCELDCDDCEHRRGK